MKCIVCVRVSLFSHTRFVVTLWTVAFQAPLPMGFSRQEHWSGLMFLQGISQARDWACVSYISCIGRQVPAQLPPGKPLEDPNERWVLQMIHNKPSLPSMLLKPHMHKRMGLTLEMRKIPWQRKWQPTPVFFSWKSHGQRSLGQATVHGITKE